MFAVYIGSCCLFLANRLCCKFIYFFILLCFYFAYSMLSFLFVPSNYLLCTFTKLSHRRFFSYYFTFVVSFWIVLFFFFITSSILLYSALFHSFLFSIANCLSLKKYFSNDECSFHCNNFLYMQ